MRELATTQAFFSRRVNHGPVAPFSQHWVYQRVIGLAPSSGCVEGEFEAWILYFSRGFSKHNNATGNGLRSTNSPRLKQHDPFKQEAIRFAYHFPNLHILAFHRTYPPKLRHSIELKLFATSVGHSRKRLQTNSLRTVERRRFQSDVCHNASAKPRGTGRRRDSCI